MIPEDLTFEVRDRTYARLGSIEPGAILEALIQPELNDAGSWSLQIPAGHALAGALRQPGAGIIVSIDGAEVFSGPTTAPRHKQGLSTAAVIHIEGVSDNIVVLEELAYPNPDSAVASHQIAETDTRTGTPGAVLAGFINANIGSNAPAARRRGSMVAINESSRSGTITKHGRMQDLGELAVEICNPNSMGFNVVQEGSRLVARVFDLRNRAGLVRFSIENGQLQAVETGKTAPTLTRVIVAGQGEAENRRIVEVTTPGSLAAEAAWGIRRAQFIDQPGEQDESALRQAGEDALASAGGGSTEIVSKAIPADEASKRYGSSWRVGDQVTLETGAGEEVALITGATIKIGPAGVQVGAVTGPLRRWDREKAALMAKVNRRSTPRSSGGGGGSGGSASLEFGTIGPEPIFGESGLVRLVKEGSNTPTGYEYQWLRDYAPAVNDRVCFLGNTILGRAIGAPYDNGQWTEPAPPTGRLPDADRARYGELRFTKLSSGWVLVDGALYVDTSEAGQSGAHLFTLPVDFRPATGFSHSLSGRSYTSSLYVRADGSVVISGTWGFPKGFVIFLSGLRFNTSTDALTPLNSSIAWGQDAFGMLFVAGSEGSLNPLASMRPSASTHLENHQASGSSYPFSSLSPSSGYSRVSSLSRWYPASDDSVWHTIPLQNAWQTTTGFFAPAVTLRPDGAVVLRGAASGGLSGTLVGTIPEGMRPKYELVRRSFRIQTNGEIHATGSDELQFVHDMWIADH